MLCGNMRFSLLLLGSLLLFGAQSQESPHLSRCEIPESVQLQMLSMSIDDFDQEDGGWRQYETSVCYTSVSHLIDRYFEKNRDLLSDRDKRVLRFHSGQMYAFAGQNSLARDRFSDALTQERESGGSAWNAYVYATLAYIDRDLNMLKRHRDQIAVGESRLNLAIVENLILFFNEPYFIAFAGPTNANDALVDLLVWHPYVRINPEAYSPGLKAEIEVHLSRAMRYVTKRLTSSKGEERLMTAAEVNYARLLVATSDGSVDSTAMAAENYASALEPCADWKGLHNCPEKQAAFAVDYQRSHPDEAFSMYLPLLAAHRWLCTAEAYAHEMRPADAERSQRQYEQSLFNARRSKSLLIRAAADRLAARGRCFASKAN